VGRVSFFFCSCLFFRPYPKQFVVFVLPRLSDRCVLVLFSCPALWVQVLLLSALLFQTPPFIRLLFKTSSSLGFLEHAQFPSTIFCVLRGGLSPSGLLESFPPLISSVLASTINTALHRPPHELGREAPDATGITVSPIVTPERKFSPFAYISLLYRPFCFCRIDYRLSSG